MEQDQILDQIKGIGDTTKEAVKAAEARLAKSLEEKSASAKEDAIKEAKTVIAELKASIEGKYDDEIQSLKDGIKAAKDELKKFQAEQGTDFGGSNYAATMADSIIAELKKPENREKLKSIKGNASQKAEFNITIPSAEFKDAAAMTRANVTGGTAMVSNYENGTIRVVRRNPFLRNILSVGRTGSQFVVYFEQTSPDGGAGMTGENSPKTQADFDWVERNQKVQKVTSYIKVSTEALEDIDEAESDIRQELIELIELKLDEQLLTGDGLSNNIKGIAEWATAFSSGGIVVADPTEADVIRTAVAVMVNNNFQPSHVLISPLDAGVIDMTKGQDGHYTLPPFKTADGRVIAGVSVVENPGVAQGSAYLIDASKVKVRIRKELAVKVGYDADDFTNNRVTFLAEVRACLFVASNHANAVVAIDFETALTAIGSEASS